MAGSGVWLGSGPLLLAFVGAPRWRMYCTVRWELDRPPGDDRRRDESTAARLWNVGDRYGALGDTFFFLMSNAKLFEKTLHCDEQGQRTYTVLRLRSPNMDSIRKFGLHPLQEETPPDEQSVVACFKETLMAFSGNQTAKAQLCRTYRA